MSNLVKHSKHTIGKDYEALNYLKKEEISSVLSMALGELYLSKPKNQLYFLGNWLLNYSKSLKKQVKASHELDNQILLQIDHEKALEMQKDSEAKIAEEAGKVHEKEGILRGLIGMTREVDEFLPKVIEHISNHIKAAAGYIGLQEKVKKQVTPLDDDKAHIDDDAPWVIKYIAATSNSQFMIDQILKEEEGQATWGLWKEDEEEDIQEEENLEETKRKPKIKVCSVDDVVSDPRIKFFDVPKLGAYFAVPLNYKTCLYEQSFDAGIEDALECRKLRAQQEEEKIKFESGAVEGEEQKEFEEIKEAPFKTSEIRMVIAFDTMGQDRTFTEQEKEYVIYWVGYLKEQWERAENESLSHDIQAFTTIRDRDFPIIVDKGHERSEQEKSVIEDTIKTLHISLPDDFKNLEGQTALFELCRNRLLGELDNLYMFKEFKVVKHIRVIQLLLYLSGVKREDVIEPGTNMMKWKKGKNFLTNDLREFIAELKPRGSKPEKVEPYAKTFKLEKDLLKVSFEEVQQYCLSMIFLYKFLEQYLKVRILDVTYRRKEYLTKVEIRENAKKAAEELAERKQKYLDEQKEAFDKENDVELDDGINRSFFDSVKVLSEFDMIEGNQPIEIPEDVIPDEDGDIDWEESNPN
ncbi:hypothetical protein SteCoe_17305 [Stentor coeruleus]|uniref:Uncharacterized protein n=1 Tax=Stentor coeruleus TaxID=5963 RepID=A0A1R2BZH8_9CILI|nr:hypothetical protein SteCoe_17305 [Stentor coeruleus]